jgi:hypothetical protein
MFVHINHRAIGDAAVEVLKESPQVTERIIETRVECVPTLIPHDHPSELPPAGAPYGGVLTNAEHGLAWQPLRNHKDAYDRIEALERTCLSLRKDIDVNNREKQATIDRLNAYWLDKHPDCFTDMADGRKLFRQELLDLKHDVLLTDLYNRKPAAIAAPQKQKQWPLWTALTVLFVVELAHVYFH